MATFRKATFNAATYSSFRPTYPPQLFDFVFRYHERGLPEAKWDTAVDLGCGTGQATTELTPFKRVIGVDPSAGMLEGARQHCYRKPVDETQDIPQYEFVQAAAEELGFIPEGSVDLIVSAQAAHWFDWTKFWPECARVLRKGGSAAFWIYSEFRLTRYPSLSPLITAYAQGTKDPTSSLGAHWQQPGRSILDNHLLAVPEAMSVVPGKFTSWERVFFAGAHHPTLPTPHHPVLLRKPIPWSSLLAYFHTWSSLHTYHELYPEDLTHPEGNLAVRFWQLLKEGVAKDGGRVGDEDEVEVEWPMALILVKRA